MIVVFFQAEDGIRDLVRSRGLGDVYKRQTFNDQKQKRSAYEVRLTSQGESRFAWMAGAFYEDCLLYTSDAADERSSVDLGGRRIIKKKKTEGNRSVDIEKGK